MLHSQIQPNFTTYTVYILFLICILIDIVETFQYLYLPVISFEYVSHQTEIIIHYRLRVESLPCVHDYLFMVMSFAYIIFYDIIQVHVIALFNIKKHTSMVRNNVPIPKPAPKYHSSVNISKISVTFEVLHTYFHSFRTNTEQHRTRTILQLYRCFFFAVYVFSILTMRFGRPITHKSYRRGSQLTSPIIWNWIMANRIRLARPTVIPYALFEPHTLTQNYTKPKQQFELHVKLRGYMFEILYLSFRRWFAYSVHFLL